MLSVSPFEDTSSRHRHSSGSRRQVYGLTAALGLPPASPVSVLLPVVSTASSRRSNFRRSLRRNARTLDGCNLYGQDNSSTAQVERNGCTPVPKQI